LLDADIYLTGYSNNEILSNSNSNNEILNRTTKKAM
jgi:hypothetical protein